MYNGIGLTTPRGSGTNGHVQRNWAFVRPGKKDNSNYRAEDDIQKLDATLNRPPNKEILDHDRKRKIEVKCIEYEELLERQGCSAEEIRNKVDSYRQKLVGLGRTDLPKDEFGRVTVRETHQIAEAQQAKNAKLREAFNISEYFVEGSSFDSDRKAKEDLAKGLALQKELDAQRESIAAATAAAGKDKDSGRRYALVRTPSKDKDIIDGSGRKNNTTDGDTREYVSKSEKKKKRKRTRESSVSPERKKEKKKKSKKHKKESKSKKKKSRKRKSSESNSNSSDRNSENYDYSSSDSSEQDLRKQRKKSKRDKKKREKKKKRDHSKTPVRSHSNFKGNPNHNELHSKIQNSNRQDDASKERSKNPFRGDSPVISNRTSSSYLRHSSLDNRDQNIEKNINRNERKSRSRDQREDLRKYKNSKTSLEYKNENLKSPHSSESNRNSKSTHHSRLRRHSRSDYRSRSDRRSKSEHRSKFGRRSKSVRRSRSIERSRSINNRHNKSNDRFSSRKRRQSEKGDWRIPEKRQRRISKSPNDRRKNISNKKRSSSHEKSYVDSHKDDRKQRKKKVKDHQSRSTSYQEKQNKNLITPPPKIDQQFEQEQIKMKNRHHNLSRTASSSLLRTQTDKLVIEITQKDDVKPNFSHISSSRTPSPVNKALKENREKSAEKPECKLKRRRSRSYSHSCSEKSSHSREIKRATYKLEKKALHSCATKRSKSRELERATSTEKKYRSASELKVAHSREIKSRGSTPNTLKAATTTKLKAPPSRKQTYNLTLSKCSLVEKSKSPISSGNSSDLSYSPARRDPERYREILDSIAMTKIKTYSNEHAKSKDSHHPVRDIKLKYLSNDLKYEKSERDKERSSKNETRDTNLNKRSNKPAHFVRLHTQSEDDSDVEQRVEKVVSLDEFQESNHEKELKELEMLEQLKTDIAAKAKEKLKTIEQMEATSTTGCSFNVSDKDLGRRGMRNSLNEFLAANNVAVVVATPDSNNNSPRTPTAVIYPQPLEEIKNLEINSKKEPKNEKNDDEAINRKENEEKPFDNNNKILKLPKSENGQASRCEATAAAVSAAVAAINLKKEIISSRKSFHKNRTTINNYSSDVVAGAGAGSVSTNSCHLNYTLNNVTNVACSTTNSFNRNNRINNTPLIPSSHYTNQLLSKNNNNKLLVSRRDNHRYSLTLNANATATANAINTIPTNNFNSNHLLLTNNHHNHSHHHHHHHHHSSHSHTANAVATTAGTTATIADQLLMAASLAAVNVRHHGLSSQHQSFATTTATNNLNYHHQKQKIVIKPFKINDPQPLVAALADSSLVDTIVSKVSTATVQAAENAARRSSSRARRSRSRHRHEGGNNRRHSTSRSRSSRYSSSSSLSRSRSNSTARSRSHSSNSSSSSCSSSKSSSSSGSSQSGSRSPSIPRRRGSPSFLDRRRITSARKRPIPYHRKSSDASSYCSSCFSHESSICSPSHGDGSRSPSISFRV